jgi:cell division protein FtsB
LRRGGGDEDEFEPARSARRSPAPRRVVDDDEPVVAPRSRRALRRVAWPLVVTVLVCLTLALGVFPTRTYLEKKKEVSLAQEQVDNLTRQNDEKQARVDTLQTPEEIEAIARGEYNLVKPGEESYEVLPEPEVPVQLPDAWPFNQLETDLDVASR